MQEDGSPSPCQVLKLLFIDPVVRQGVGLELEAQCLSIGLFQFKNGDLGIV